MEQASILFIDDTANNRKLYQTVLQRAEYQVRTSASAEEALVALEKIQPRLVIVDVRLGKIDGFTLMQRMKSDPHTRDIPVILITAYHEEFDKNRAREAGAADFILLPVDIPTFVSRVHRIVHAS